MKGQQQGTSEHEIIAFLKIEFFIFEAYTTLYFLQHTFAP
jgi:hypothetical protein